MQSDDEIIAVVQAHKEGKKIERRPKNAGAWFHLPIPHWNFDYYDYRVAPEPPKPREWMAYVRENGTLLPFNVHCTPQEALRYQAIRVREVIEGASSGNHTVASDTASCNQ